MVYLKLKCVHLLLEKINEVLNILYRVAFIRICITYCFAKLLQIFCQYTIYYIYMYIDFHHHSMYESVETRYSIHINIVNSPRIASVAN